MAGIPMISGKALIGEELEVRKVDIVMDRGIITHIEDNPRAPELWICPALFNAHTHLGDTIAMDCRTSGDLAALVTPPDGLKHRILRAAAPEMVVRGMRASMEGMAARGIAGCGDFREGGVSGVAALREAVAGLPFRTYIFGREGGEKDADGLGISSVRDTPDATNQVDAARKAGKKIAFHAGERDAEDVDSALALDPDLIVHATHATRRQIRECADRGIPIAVCPRSNWTLGVAGSPVHPPLRLMRDLGCILMLGTDNVMFVAPDLFSEMAFVSSVYRLDPRTILQAAVRGSQFVGQPFFITEKMPANFFSIDPARSALQFSHDPVASLVKRAAAACIASNVFTL